MRRTFTFLSLAAALALAATGAVHAGTVRDNEVVDRTGEIGYYELRDHFPGGDQALPYGQFIPGAVLTHARGLDAVRGAIATLEARGYHRRPDADGAGTQSGFSFALIAFEKPGIPVTDRQPVLVVATQAVEVPGIGFRPATQLYSGMFADSAGEVHVVSTAADSGIVFVGTLLAPLDAYARAMYAAFGTPAGTQNTDENIAFRYSAYEHRGTWQYTHTTSPEMQGLMSQAYQHVAWNVVGGAVSGCLGYTAGPAIGTASVLVGGYTSGLIAWHTFWIGRTPTPTPPKKK